MDCKCAGSVEADRSYAYPYIRLTGKTGRDSQPIFKTRGKIRPVSASNDLDFLYSVDPRSIDSGICDQIVLIKILYTAYGKLRTTIMTADAYIAIPCGCGTVMCEAFAHVGRGLTFPYLKTDAKHRNSNLTDRSISQVHSCGVREHGRLCDSRKKFRRNVFRAGQVHDPFRWITDLLHSSVFHIVFAAIGKLRDLIIDQVCTAILVFSSVLDLIAGIRIILSLLCAAEAIVCSTRKSNC